MLRRRLSYQRINPLKKRALNFQANCDFDGSADGIGSGTSAPSQMAIGDLIFLLLTRDALWPAHQ
jgi:hypothetical protein